tara:strand:- start:197 stop:802 length:606 start_codon:yes stop_codon:yes gene_type:complete
MAKAPPPPKKVPTLQAKKVGSSSLNPPSTIPIEISSAINRLEEFDRKRKLLDWKHNYWRRGVIIGFVHLGALIIGFVGMIWAEGATNQPEWQHNVAPILCFMGVFGLLLSFLTPRFLRQKGAGLGFFEGLVIDDALIDLDFVNRYSVETGNYSLQGQLLEYHKGIARHAKQVRNSQAAAALGAIIIGSAAGSVFKELKKGP